MNWTMIKVLAAHAFADYGIQTCRMAQHKNACARTRAQHIACVAGALSVAMATDNKLTLRQKMAIVIINAGAHWVIDSFRMAKWIDQALHVGVAVGSVYAVNWHGGGK